MSKYTYKRETTRQTFQVVALYWFLFLTLHGFCMDFFLFGDVSKHVTNTSDTIQQTVGWNAHTHMFWNNGQKMGGFSPPTWLRLGEVGPEHTMWVVCECVTERRVTWMTIRERFLNVSVFSSMLKVVLFKRVQGGSYNRVSIVRREFSVCIGGLVYFSSKCYQH